MKHQGVVLSNFLSFDCLNLTIECAYNWQVIVNLNVVIGQQGMRYRVHVPFCIFDSAPYPVSIVLLQVPKGRTTVAMVQ